MLVAKHYQNLMISVRLRCFIFQKINKNLVLASR